MKAKKRFCAKSSGFVGKARKLKLPSFAALINPISQWRLGRNVKLYPRESEKCFCDASFHESIYPVMLVAQCFGVLPVLNISAKCPSGLRYTWKSLRFAFAVLVMMSCGLEAAFAVAWTFRTRVEFGKMVILVFYITNFMSFFCFIRLAKFWPQIMLEWHEVERKLPPNATERDKRAMCVRIRRVAFVILMLSAIEHILSIFGSVSVVIDCPRIQNILKAYYVHNFPQVFSFFSYSHVLGIFVKFVHVTSTFVWSFTDLFIIMVSCGLSARFKQINERLMVDKGKVRPVDSSEVSLRFQSIVMIP